VGRSDTTLLLHVYADHQHAIAVSIPRDTLVTIPPCRLPSGTWTKEQPQAMFNAAFSIGEAPGGNPACTQNTVEHLTGLHVDHTIVVDFRGFSQLTQAVGGVEVCVPQDIYQQDLNPHLGTRGKQLFSKGKQSVAGPKALDYVRLRHGIGDGSDIGRIKRQQAFLASLLKKIKSEGFTPGRLMPLAHAATQSLTVDPGLGSADKLITFAMTLRDISLDDTRFVTAPWRYQGERVALVEPDASALWSALNNDRTLDGKDGRSEHSMQPTSPPPVSGAGITVEVLNGTSTPGLAAKTAHTLRKHRFTVTHIGTAPGKDRSATTVEFGPGQETQAKITARLFSSPELRPTSTGGITVTLGQADARAHPSRPSNTPSPVSPDLMKQGRSAADSPCSNLSFG
jgi:LCP family protein required for cell wall assembly